MGCYACATANTCRRHNDAEIAGHQAVVSHHGIVVWLRWLTVVRGLALRYRTDPGFGRGRQRHVLDIRQSLTRQFGCQRIGAP